MRKRISSSFFAGLSVGLAIACAATWPKPSSEADATARYEACMSAKAACEADLSEAVEALDELNSVCQ